MKSKKTFVSIEGFSVPMGRQNRVRLKLNQIPWDK